jgi:hypothetical protein
MGFSLRLIKQWDNDNGKRDIFFAPSLSLRQPSFTNAWMQNSFEFVPRGRVHKNNVCQFITAQGTVRGNNFLSEGIFDFSQGRLSRPDQFAGKMISVHYPGPARLKEPGGCGLSHANATGQSAKFHRQFTSLHQSTIEAIWE